MPTGTAGLDAFESLFRSAMKDVFHLNPPACERVIVLSDGREDAEALRESVAMFLGKIDSSEHLDVSIETEWAKDPSPVLEVTAMIARNRPDLVVTRRHLLGSAKNLPHTLGSVVDTLSQTIDMPLMLLPPPGTALPSSTDRVMVITDHLAGDDRLVNVGVQFTHRHGTLFLAHIEDQGLLDYYLDAIDKMAEIDSALARERMPARLLKAPQEYIASVAEVLRAAAIEETVVPIVQLGSGVRSYQALMAEHDINLLIVNAKDARQDAMHAKAHAIAVQLRSRPLLLL